MDFSIPETYKQANKGVDGCPEGYQTITDPAQCEIASQVLGLVYRGDQNTNHDDAICNWCGGCGTDTGGLSTRVDELHRDNARWICKLQGKYIDRIPNISYLYKTNVYSSIEIKFMPL